MENKKILKLVRIFFLLFILSGVGKILNYYCGIFPNMFTKLFNMKDVICLNHVSVIQIPIVPLILVILTISLFVFLIKHLYRLIVAEIKN